MGPPSDKRGIKNTSGNYELIRCYLRGGRSITHGSIAQTKKNILYSFLPSKPLVITYISTKFRLFSIKT